MILHMGGGGGKKQLAVTVVGSAVQPAGAAGLIWVDTDLAMGMWTAAVAQPTSPDTGDVWIQTDATSATIIDLLIDNAALINVLRVKQWTGTKWASVGAWYHDGTDWGRISSAFDPETDISYTGDMDFVDEGDGNWNITLTTSGTLTFTVEPPEAAIDVLLVAGGGGGGKALTDSGGGGAGGGGGAVYDEDHAVTAGDYPVVIGAGAVATTSSSVRGNLGGNSTFDGLTATGGGGGGSGTSTTGRGGGCGGGGAANAGSGAAGTQGGNGANAGAINGGGGGGMGGNGSGTAGGVALSNSITGTAVGYAGGGGGGVSGGGAQSNTPGGGGGGGWNTGNPTGGKDGLMIFRNARS
jgi:hypothetical protein